MNVEQVEGRLSEFEGKPISVVIPIRGTIVQVFYGTLEIKHDWENHIIIYSVKFYPDVEISFQAQDVDRIVDAPNDLLDATVILKGDVWLEQSKFSHA